MSVIEWNLNRNSECKRCRNRKEPDVWTDRLRFCLANQIPIRISEERSSRFSLLLWLHFITRNNISINYKYWLNRRVPLYSHSEPNTTAYHINRKQTLGHFRTQTHPISIYFICTGKMTVLDAQQSWWDSTWWSMFGLFGQWRRPLSMSRIKRQSSNFTHF